MKTIEGLGATAVASVALAAAMAGCSSRTSDTALIASTIPVTSPAPAVSRPLTDFAEDPDGPQFVYYSFGTPSGQIQCRVVDGTGLACQTEGRSHTVADSALCGFYPGFEQGSARRFGFFDERKQPCATIIQGEGFNSPHTLAYGQSVTAKLSSGLTITCTSATAGLTCTQADGTGPGFYLSIDTFTVL